MRAPRVIVRYFTHESDRGFNRLARVLEASLRQHCPSWTRDFVDVGFPHALQSATGRQGDIANTHKLAAWVQAMASAQDGERLAFFDADLMVRKSLDDVWFEAFDVAVTTKPRGSRYEYNGGVVFVRVSPTTRAFMARWGTENRLMFDDPREHNVWRPAFGGINQSALGKILKHGGHGLQVKRLPCLEWNCEDEHWGKFNPGLTRIVHVKSGLAKAVLGRRDAVRGFDQLVEEWRAVEHRIVTDVPIGPGPDLPVGPDRNTQITSDELLKRAPETAPEEHSEPPPKLSRRQRRRQAAQVGGV